MKYLKIILIILFLPLLAQAAPAPGFLDSLSCIESGNCQLADVAAGFISLIRLLLGAMGAVALLYFVVGGFQLMTSQGNQEKVRNGQRTMVNTLIALAIAFTSYLLLNFFVNNILNVKSDYKITGTPMPRQEQTGGECSGKAQGEACNSSELNYVCSGPELQDVCVTKCALINMIPSNKESLDFYGLGFACNDITSNAGAFHLSNKCPGNTNNVCILYESGSAVLDSYLNSAAATWMKATIDGLQQ